MNQLDIVKAAGHQPFYEQIDLGEWRAELAGTKIRVRVNPTRKVRREMQELYERSQTLGKDPDAASDAEAKEIGTRYNAIVASLIPRAETGDETITPAELDAFLAGGDDDDDSLQQWVLTQVWQRVYQYFLSARASRNN